MNTRELVVCFPFLASCVILGERKDDPWKGDLSGFGGQVEPEESPLEAQVRELEEEAGIIVKEEDLILAGRMKIIINGKEKALFIFTTETWEGEPRETEEMSPRWYEIGGIPYHKMIDGDNLWFPWIVAGYYVEGVIVRDKNFRLVSLEFAKVRFVW